MRNKQPEALRLADWIESDMTCQGDAEIATELRRLHALSDKLLGAVLLIMSAHPAIREASDDELHDAAADKDVEVSAIARAFIAARAAVKEAAAS